MNNDPPNLELDSCQPSEAQQQLQQSQIQPNQQNLQNSQSQQNQKSLPSQQNQQSQQNQTSQQCLPNQPQQRKVALFRPEQMRLLPDQFTSEERSKWETGLRTLWMQIEKNAPDSSAHIDAKRKLFEFSRTLQSKIQSSQAQKIAHSPSQGQLQGDIEGYNSNVQARQQPQSKISPKIMEHMTNFPFQLPPNIQVGTEAAQKWLQTAKSGYLKALMAMEHCSIRLTTAEAILKNKISEGKQLTAEEEKEWIEKKELAHKQHADAKTYVDQFRQQQNQYKIASMSGPQVTSGQQTGANGNNSQVTLISRTQMSTQQPSPVTQTVNAAIEAARNQQISGRRTPQNSQTCQVSSQSEPTQTSAPNIKVEGNLTPSIITATSQIQGQQKPAQISSQPGPVSRPAGNAPQSGTSQHLSQQPQALSHSDALGLVARTYSSNSQPMTSIMGHSHPNSVEKSRSDVSVSNKLPIPKHLPDHATALPQPVSMPQARPTLTGGPSNVSNGMLGQPVMTKMPGFNMEGEGDRVLSKKKLDELVRQVTGGGQGGSDGADGVCSLAPDVEEVADNFVDQVLQAACKNAKERGSRTLEIRDIQLTLERGYNIRIPGYASDEIRTVRKIQPAPGWIAKMSAVQAAKVTGGKNNE